jgi:hypothetical protein
LPMVQLGWLFRRVYKRIGPLFIRRMDQLSANYDV